MDIAELFNDFPPALHKWFGGEWVVELNPYRLEWHIRGRNDDIGFIHIWGSQATLNNISRLDFCNKITTEYLMNMKERVRYNGKQ